MPLTYKKDVPKLCKECKTNDSEKFTACVYDICKECKKVKSSKIYSCNYCDETNPLNFYEGRYSRCKKCRIAKEKKKVFETKAEELPENKNLKIALRKCINDDYVLFDGMTLPLIIEELKNDILFLKKENMELRKENDELKYNHDKLKKNIEDNINVLYKNLSIDKFFKDSSLL